MGSLSDTVKTINSTVRTLILAAVAALAGTVGFLGYQHYTASERALQTKQAELQAVQGRLVTLQSDLEAAQVDLAHKIEQIAKLETALKMLKTDQRLARLDVIELQKDEAGTVIRSLLEFVELSPSGDLLSPPKRFSLPGDVIYIDNWVVKFDDQYVEQADIERGTSLVLFRRVFSEHQQPTEGVILDEVGRRPQAYASGGALSEFERKLWSEFWEFANDPKKAADMGIRAANGEAISIQVREGMSYHLQLRNSGGMSFQPVLHGNQ